MHKRLLLSRELVTGVILLVENRTDLNFSIAAEELSQLLGNRLIERVDSSVSPGFYYYRDNAVWKVMRLYDDCQGAFLVSIKPRTNEGSEYEVLNDGKHGWYVHSTLTYAFSAFSLKLLYSLGSRLGLKSFSNPLCTLSNTDCLQYFL